MNKLITKGLVLVLTVLFAGPAYGSSNKESSGNYPTLHKPIEVNGLKIFYREAGPKNAPTLLLLHGYPTSSHMFRNLIENLSHRYHLLAPDYPGYGRSEQARLLPRVS